MNVGTGRNDADAAEFVERCHRGLRQHTSGNPRPYLDLWSDADDVSLMGGVGGHQVGLEQVSELLTAAAKTLNYETWDAENLATVFGDTERIVEESGEVLRVPGFVVERLGRCRQKLGQVVNADLMTADSPHQ